MKNKFSISTVNVIRMKGRFCPEYFSIHNMKYLNVSVFVPSRILWPILFNEMQFRMCIFPRSLIKSKVFFSQMSTSNKLIYKSMLLTRGTVLPIRIQCSRSVQSLAIPGLFYEVIKS
jgi:hypothetical protein